MELNQFPPQQASRPVPVRAAQGLRSQMGSARLHRSSEGETQNIGCPRSFLAQEGCTKSRWMSNSLIRPPRRLFLRSIQGRSCPYAGKSHGRLWGITLSSNELYSFRVSFTTLRRYLMDVCGTSRLAAEPLRPAQPVEVVQARPIVGEPPQQVGVVAGVVNSSPGRALRHTSTLQH